MVSPQHDNISPAPGVRAATGSDRDALVSTLVRAFDADPITSWFVLDDRRRPERMARLFRWYLGEVLSMGLSHTTGDCSAVALWTGPRQRNLSLFRQFQLFPEMLRIAGLRRIFSRLRGLNRLQRHPAQPHYYLAMLGTAPALQGRGLGAAVLRPGLARCDREQLPAYLETAALQTVPFYQRRGFRLCGEVSIPHGGPLVRLMWRQPQARQADADINPD